MTEKDNNKNKVVIAGKIDKPVMQHTDKHGVPYYTFSVNVLRIDIAENKSESFEIRACCEAVRAFKTGDGVELTGRRRSLFESGRKVTVIEASAVALKPAAGFEYKNMAVLSGQITKLEYKLDRNENPYCQFDVKVLLKDKREYEYFQVRAYKDKAGDFISKGAKTGDSVEVSGVSRAPIVGNHKYSFVQAFTLELKPAAKTKGQVA